MERLKLVEPAASLWRTAGPAIRRALKELQDGPHEWRFGGGTILATRWEHRLSFDIDLTVTSNADRWELAPECNAEFDTAMRHLGGEPKHAPGSVKIAGGCPREQGDTRQPLSGCLVGEPGEGRSSYRLHGGTMRFIRA